MSLSLYVDGERWRTHLRRTLTDLPGLVPVAKGNGYGFTNGRLARRTAWLGCDTIAVGTYDELGDVSSRFDGDLLVLSPWRPFLDDARRHAVDPRVLHTVGRLADLAELVALGSSSTAGRPRVVLERATSMRRHGLDADGLRAAAELCAQGGVRLEGVSLHLPLPGSSHLDEVQRLLEDVVAAGLARGSSTGEPTTVWASHLLADELGTLTSRWPDLRFRQRVGTDLWLGDPDALHPRATVLDAHPVRRGETYGYRGRSAPRDGTLLVVSGGTAHGIGMESPTGAPGIRAKAISVARGGLDAAGWVRSPYTVAGRHRLFAEPPHMQASMLFLPARVTPPEVGSEIPVRVRYTTTRFDRVVFSDA